MPRATERIRPAFHGMNTNSSPDYLDQAEGELVENLLVDREGKLVMRGPLRRRVDMADNAADQSVGGAVWTFDDTLLVPYHVTGTPTTYFCKRFILPSGTPTNVAGSNYALQRFYDRLGDFVYGGYIDYSATPVVRLLQWTGGATLPFRSYVNAPTDFVDVKVHQKRLMVLGGTDPTTGVKPVGKAVRASTPNVLYWSDPGGPITDVATYWQDDVSGLTNMIVLDCSTHDGAVGMAHAGRTLVVFMSHSIHTITGDGPSTWVVRPISREIGCTYRDAIQEYEDGVLFINARRGLMWTDGLTIETISTPVQAEFLASISTANSGFVTMTSLNNGYVMVSVQGHAAWLVHVPSRRWARISTDSAITTLHQIQVMGASLTYPFAMTYSAYDSSLWLLDELTVPEMSTEATRGKDTKAATSKRIPARWHSRLASLSTPSMASQVQRVLFDYSFYRDGAVAEGAGWFLSAVDGQGGTVLTESQVASQLDPPTQLVRKRAQLDCFKEATDIQLRVEWKDDGSGTAPALVQAEIYDVTVEFAPAMQRSNA